MSIKNEDAAVFIDSGSSAKVLIQPKSNSGKPSEDSDPSSTALITDTENATQDNSTETDDGNAYLTRHLRRVPLAGHLCVAASCVMMTASAAMVKVLTTVDPFQVIDCL